MARAIACICGLALLVGIAWHFGKADRRPQPPGEVVATVPKVAETEPSGAVQPVEFIDLARAFEPASEAVPAELPIDLSFIPDGTEAPGIMPRAVRKQLSLSDALAGVWQDIRASYGFQRQPTARDLEAEDLRIAREEVRRFWMNNQPSVMTYERLNGEIFAAKRRPSLTEWGIAILHRLKSFYPILRPIQIQAVGPDPNQHMQQLLGEREDSRQARQEIRRFWMMNQPSVLNYERLNGSISP